jgi:hypothetical protein
VFPASDRDAVLSAAASTAAEHPELVFHNPQRRERCWELQRDQRAAFVRHFGADEITVPADEVPDLMGGFWATLGGGGMALPADESWLHGDAETVGIIFDEPAGLGMYLDYALAQEAFADPELMRRRRHKETVKAYFTDDSVDPVPLQRLAARHPDNASRVLRAALGKPGLSWEADGERLLRQFKKAWYERPAFPRVSVVSQRLAAYLRDKESR